MITLLQKIFSLVYSNLLYLFVAFFFQHKIKKLLSWDRWQDFPQQFHEFWVIDLFKNPSELKLLVKCVTNFILTVARHRVLNNSIEKTGTKSLDTWPNYMLTIKGVFLPHSTAFSKTSIVIIGIISPSTVSIRQCICLFPFFVFI